MTVNVSVLLYAVCCILLVLFVTGSYPPNLSDKDRTLVRDLHNNLRRAVANRKVTGNVNGIRQPLPQAGDMYQMVSILHEHVPIVCTKTFHWIRFGSINLRGVGRTNRF